MLKKIFPNKLMNFFPRLKTKYYKFIYPNSNNIIVKHRYFMGANLLVVANETVGQQILAGSFESEDIDFFISSIQANDVFFDIGANVGVFSILAKSKVPSCFVHLFEPIPLNCSLIRVSSQINDMQSIYINECVLSDVEKSFSFSKCDDSAFSSINNTGRSKETKKLTVKSTTIDLYTKKHKIKKIDLIKIDVEGAEKLVLDGAKDIFRDSNRKPRLMLIELYDGNLGAFNTSSKEIVNILKEYNYIPFVLIEGEKQIFSQAQHKSIYNIFFELEKNI